MAVRRLNHAVLFVRDVRRSVAFYHQVFGFTVEHEIPGIAAFLRAQGSDNDHDLGLFALGPEAPGPQRDRVGLHHLAWEVGTLGELVETSELLDARGALTGSTDFLVAKSLHGVDPDGHEFEVLWRTPRSDWPAAEENQKPLPLDLRSAIDRWGPDLRTGAAAGTAT
ncbi:glyoxalase/bleomycin resistance protein/dioxygenase superfamily protein [Streptomyces sp. TLI_55]|uniref:VOC family protein n=1 Tax=Streptomyces sp. TLI_55 TaxID=1938861 RepID=UPI000BD24D27|nr:VOC family protein [Streptomyces sp. TLI_55]SNX63180.1 glyoxalase/bleomycin resistance protein/dioxygenase superfamily protein [Streptomyces sp. TLI_55]